MQRRVRWQDIAFQTRGIDQTQLHIDDRHKNTSEFSFLVLLDLGNPLQQDLMNDYQSKIHQINEKQRDIRQKLDVEQLESDREQLNWFKQKLILSWSDSTVRGRIVYLHHSPYTTESTKHQLEETSQVRHHLRQILAEVGQTMGYYTQGRPLVAEQAYQNWYHYESDSFIIN